MGRTLLLAALAAAASRSSAQNPQLALNFCTGSATQLFYYDPANSTIVLAAQGLCIDIIDYGTSPGAEAYTAPCHHDDHDPTHQNQEFSPLSTSAPGAPVIQRMANLSIDSGGLISPGSAITLSVPSPDSALWLNVSTPANGGTGTLVHSPSGLCFDAAGAAGGASTPVPVALNTCGQGGGGDTTTSRQSFLLTPSGTVQLAAPTLTGASLCLSVGTLSTTSRLSAAPCPPPGVPVPHMQAFTLSTQGNLVSALYNRSVVVDWADPTAVAPRGWAGLPVQLAPPSPTSPWATDGIGLPDGAVRLVHAASGLCMDVGGVPNSHGCLEPAVRGFPFCDATVPIPARVADLLSRLTLAEKIALTGSAPISDTCDTIDPGVARLDIPPHQWLVETNSMAASACYGSTCATSFPSALNLAAAFNRTLWNAKGQVVSTEMRVLNNLRWHRSDGQAGTMISLSGFGPDLNQPRDPRNGRIGELPSEDPYVIGEYGVAYVLGMQANPLDAPAYAYRLKMSAGVKHYAGYSLETNRFGSKGNFSTFDLWDTYLKAYEKTFVVGGAAGSMCAYISLSVDGGPAIPACASTYLLQTVVREYWARPDAVHTSDCGAVSNMANENHYVKNLTYAAAAALNGGMNLNSNTILPDNLATAIALGFTDEATLDTAVSQTLALRMRLGLLDPLEDQPYTRLGVESLHTPESAQLVQSGVAQGIVLVKNEGGALPLTPGLKLAVVGPLADDAYALIGDYYADDVCPTPSGEAGRLGHDYSCVSTITAALGAANVGGTTATFPGVQMSSNDTTWGAALAAVASADATVLVLGTDQTIGHEAMDLSHTGLPGLQSAFGLAVLAAAAPGKPVILLMLGTFPTAFDALAAPTPAIVLGYAPTFGAPAIAATLFGASNAWGRAMLTVYPQAYEGAVGLTDFRMTPGGPSPGQGSTPGRSYRYYNGSVGAPLVKFGQGLSYATYSLTCTAGYVGGASEAISIPCTVTHTGGPGGDVVLMVYHRASGDVVGRVGARHPIPLSTLVAFERVTLPAGGSVSVSINTTVVEALTLVDETGATVLYQGLHWLDVWDGGPVNNVTLPLEAPLLAGTREGRLALKQPPPFRE